MPIEATNPRRRWMPRFSLLTLLLTVLLIGSTATLWRHWDAWYCVKVLEGHASTVYSGEFSPDGKKILTFMPGDDTLDDTANPNKANVTEIWDSTTYERLHAIKWGLNTLSVSGLCGAN